MYKPAALALITAILLPLSGHARVQTKVADVCAKSKNESFRAKYCSAAKDYQKGYTTNRATSAIWAGVTTVCGMACGKAFIGSAAACQFSQTGGSVNEGILTKKFTDSLTGEATKWGTGAADNAAKGTLHGLVNVPAGKVNAEACTAAGKSAMRSYEKHSNAKQNDRSLSQLREDTKNYNSPEQGAFKISGDTQNSGDSKYGQDQSAVVANTKDMCDEAALSTALGSIRCAASADPTLPPYVKSEEFLKDLKKATGQNPDGFFKNFESPTQALAEGPLLSSLPPEQRKSLAETMKEMEGYSSRSGSQIAQGSEGKESAPVRSGSGYDADDTSFDVNGILANVLNGLEGQGAENNPASEELAVDRKPSSENSQQRSAGMPEDRSVSLFERVKWRYGAVVTREHLGVQ